MGGEWIFEFTTRPNPPNTALKPLDLTKYQELLLKLKAKYESKFEGGPITVTWCDVNALPPPDNIFVRFKATCTRHNWNEPEHPWFNLYWTLDPEAYSREMDGSIHSRCTFVFANLEHSRALFDLQREIVEAFPENFTLLREICDGHTYDSTGKFTYHEDLYSYEDDSDLDFTACDKDDCGYCGHCWY